MLLFLLAILGLFLSFALIWIISSLQWKKFNPGERPKQWAQPIQQKSLNNFYQINSEVFRAAQPTRAGMLRLKELDFKTVLNLRHLKKDNSLIEDKSLTLEHLSINTWTLSQKEILEGVTLIKNAQKPILVHCLHGSDRTGAIIAAYRILEMNWTKEEAIAELKFGGFGYHQFYFPHILWLLMKLPQ